MGRKEFENYLIKKGDDIDNAAFDLINAFYNKGFGEEIEWDMQIIGEVVDAAEETLKSFCFGICRPFTFDEKPCYKTDECGVPDCPFKKGLNYYQFIKQNRKERLLLKSHNDDIFERLVKYEQLGKTPEELRKIMLRCRTLEFNRTIAQLEKDGYRSGGWDEKLNKTAIVKDGLRPDETKIVGWVDMDGKIEWL